MYLKALEIQGFKSFPDKTVLRFADDITAIVGPNGSGKSNISDAIRWVLGEQSVKGLRGAKMEDVIFAGAEGRSPVGFAQVTLVLDNTGGFFPSMAESEVAVTRRYYRSGESEYYLNRQAVRLRDVTDLFLDTGLGREGYSIIGQGKIDEILSTRSSERREVFEEAAGISRFRHRKEDAERKLARTEENLVRINDKIAELELQVGPLRDQAEKAKRYLLLRDELRLLEISVWLENLDALRAEARKLDTDYHTAARARDEARTTLDALFTELEGFGDEMQKIDLVVDRVRAEHTALEAQVKEHDSAVAVLETNIFHERENIGRARTSLVESDSRAGSLAAQSQAERQRAAGLKERLGALDALLNSLLSEAQASASQIGDRQTQAEALRGQEILAAAAAANAQAEAAALLAEQLQLKERYAAVETEHIAAEERLEAVRQEARANRRALDNAREDAQAAANVIAGQRLRLEERERKAAAAGERRVKRMMESDALENRIRLLTEMEKEYEGFSKAVRLVCQNRLRGVHGPVAGLMRTEPAYTLAIETALGAGLQNIVVDREEDAKAAIAFLKQREGGRATFLPLTAIQGEELRMNGVERETGFLGLASRLVRFEAPYTGIFRNLLGRTVVVEDLDCGIAIARKYRNSFRIVTLDGQVINRGGSMTGGSASRNAGILSRAAELERLREQSSLLAQQLEEAQVQEEALNRELAAVRYDLETASAQRRQAEDEVLRLEGQEQHYKELVHSLEESLENLTGEQESLSGHLEENAHEVQAAEQTRAAHEAQAAACRAEAEKALSGQTELLAQSSALTETITEKKEAFASLSAEHDAALQRAADLRRLAEELTGDRQQKEATLQGYEDHIGRAQAEIHQRQEAVELLHQKQESCQSQLAELSEKKLALEARRTAQSKASQEMNETLLNLERSVARLEQKQAAAGMEEKQILDRLWEHYELSHSDAQAQRIELESLPKAARRIGELKRDISALGTPNLGAVEEYERVNTRYTYLTDQRDDVDKAKKELETLTGSITGEMARIFAEQFRLLDESFQTTFTELFCGGQSRLELEDPDDLLNCGIDIKAQPPGKTLKTISLLSGGEKAFVAIALYFSILKVHPTPFCVMDEIEAALDDVNVTRYARYMRQLAGQTQFIVITHRRGTMEEADMLYGVTMQEKGVSKMLSINLQDMAKELDIN